MLAFSLAVGVAVERVFCCDKGPARRLYLYLCVLPAAPLLASLASLASLACGPDAVWHQTDTVSCWHCSTGSESFTHLPPAGVGNTARYPLNSRGRARWSTDKAGRIQATATISATISATASAWLPGSCFRLAQRALLAALSCNCAHVAVRHPERWIARA